MKDVLDYRALAALIGVHPQTVRRMYSKYPDLMPERGRLPGSRRVFILKADVEEWLRSRRGKQLEYSVPKPKRKGPGRPRRIDQLADVQEHQK